MPCPACQTRRRSSPTLAKSVTRSSPTPAKSATRSSPTAAKSATRRSPTLDVRRPRGGAALESADGDAAINVSKAAQSSASSSRSSPRPAARSWARELAEVDVAVAEEPTRGRSSVAGGRCGGALQLAGGGAWVGDLGGVHRQSSSSDSCRSPHWFYHGYP